jgi:hypothetical protein
MPQTAEGLKVHIDAKVLERIDAVRPAYISRTAWINQALDNAAEDRRQKLESARDFLARTSFKCKEASDG